MKLQPATLKIPHDQLVQMVCEFLRRQGWRAESVEFSSYEVGHNGPTRYEATATLTMPTTHLVPPIDTPDTP